MATYEKSFLLSLYRDMVRIRAFEEHAAECFTKGMLAGNIHLSIGQEAAEAGAFAAIEPRDYFTSTHRGHGHAIARGADPKRAMAELFGKAAGYCKGKGGEDEPPGRQRYRGRRTAHLRRQRPGLQDHGGRLRHRGLLRRRLHQRGLLPRVPEHGRRLEAAAGLVH